MAKAKCYASIYCKQEQLTQLQIPLTYCNIETEAIKRFRETFTFEELEAWFLEVMTEYLKWVDFLREERRKRNVLYVGNQKANGKTNSEIAQELNVNRCTITVYIKEYNQKYANTVINH
jgi:predicted transcriptional regulator